MAQQSNTPVQKSQPAKKIVKPVQPEQSKHVSTVVATTSSKVVDAELPKTTMNTTQPWSFTEELSSIHGGSVLLGVGITLVILLIVKMLRKGKTQTQVLQPKEQSKEQPVLIKSEPVSDTSVVPAQKKPVQDKDEWKGAKIIIRGKTYWTHEDEYKQKYRNEADFRQEVLEEYKARMEFISEIPSCYGLGDQDGYKCWTQLQKDTQRIACSPPEVFACSRIISPAILEASSGKYPVGAWWAAQVMIPVGNIHYRADFVIETINGGQLVVECDDTSHRYREKEDRVRTEAFESVGLKIFRFPTSVLRNGVETTVKKNELIQKIKSLVIDSENYNTSISLVTMTCPQCGEPGAKRILGNFGDDDLYFECFNKKCKKKKTYRREITGNMIVDTLPNHHFKIRQESTPHIPERRIDFTIPTGKRA